MGKGRRKLQNEIMPELSLKDGWQHVRWRKEKGHLALVLLPFAPEVERAPLATSLRLPALPALEPRTSPFCSPPPPSTLQSPSSIPFPSEAPSGRCRSGVLKCSFALVWYTVSFQAYVFSGYVRGIVLCHFPSSTVHSTLFVKTYTSAV